MSTRAIRTSAPQANCDVCGRTLLRGERAEVYLGGGARHSVCELCTSRALHGGWVREGTVPSYAQSSSRAGDRRSLFGRRRGRRDLEDGPAEERAEDFEEPESRGAPAPERPDSPSRGADRRSLGRRRRSVNGHDGASARESSGGREPRHVRAVPTSVENKTASAVSLFNSSEHPRTVVGIARSLGLPDVGVYPSDPVASVVNVVVSWELCWYRYEVDLSDEVPSVRVSERGYELGELGDRDREINATADDRGRLTLNG